MWRWYVEAAFLVLVCFAVGAAVAAVALARLLPPPSVGGETVSTPEASGPGSTR